MTLLDWHPYPEEKPEEWENKIVTYKRTQRKSDIQVAFFFFAGDKGVWMSPLNSTIFRKVTAWADRPQPYKRRGQR